MEEHIPVSICLFGAPIVTIDGAPLPPLRSRKGLWLIALLALRYGREVDRSWLAGTLWPESSEDKARASLRKTLNDLRSALGRHSDVVHSVSAHTITIDLSRAGIDLVRFDSAIKQGTRESLADAVALYTGSLMEGWSEDWTVQDRLLRENAYVEALEQLAQYAMEAGDHALAVRYLRFATSTDPYRESANRFLMQALASRGDYQAASETYRELRERLRDNLSAEPSMETTKLLHEILDDMRRERRGDRPRPKEHRQKNQSHKIPKPLTELVGREFEISTILRLLTGSRLVTLQAPGGFGKTRLAIAVAQEMVGDYADGVWFIDLIGVSEPALLPRAMMDAFGLMQIPEKPDLEDVVSCLEEKQALIVLDNCEHLVDSVAAMVSEIMRRCAGVVVLCTSRQALGLTGETLFMVPAMSMPDGLRKCDCQELAQFEAVRLFVERGRSARPSFVLSEENAGVVVSLLHRLDGNPLAIELAAARLRVMSLEEVHERLKDRFQVLSAGSRNLPSQHQTLLATMDWSYGLLNEEEKLLLRRLSVFSGSFSMEQVQEICSDIEGSASSDKPALSRNKVLECLTDLVDKSMVASDPSGHVTQYRLLETTKDYAYAYLIAGGEYEEAGERHADYFFKFARSVNAEVERTGEHMPFLSVDPYHENIRSAIRWYLRDECRQGDKALEFVLLLNRYWSMRGMFSEACQWFQAAIKASPDDSIAKSQALAVLSSYYLHQGQIESARKCVQDAIAMKEKLKDERGIVRSLIVLGRIAEAEGEYDLAEKHYLEVLKSSDRLNEPALAPSALTNLGMLAYVRGNYKESLEYHEKCLEIIRKHGTLVGSAWSLGNLGDTYKALKEFDKSEEYYVQSLQLFIKANAERGISECLRGLGELNALRSSAKTSGARAAKLLGAAEALRERMNAPLTAIYQAEIDACHAKISAILGKLELERLWKEGREMPLDRAVELALARDLRVAV